MSDLKNAENHRKLMERHARIAVLIDRLETQWSLCILDPINNDYAAIEDSWHKELVEELTWLNGLFATAVATEGDVRSFVG